MIPFVPLATRQRRHIMTMLLLTSVGFYFGYHLVSGNNSLMAMMQLQTKLEESKSRLDIVKMERLNLQHRVKMISSESLDLDLLDEQARKLLGHSKDGEIIYYFPKETLN